MSLLFLTNNYVPSLPGLWTTTVLRFVFIVALGVHVVVVPTRMSLVNEELTKASSEDAVVDVEVDRCIDENSASNHG